MKALLISFVLLGSFAQAGLWDEVKKTSKSVVKTQAKTSAKGLVAKKISSKKSKSKPSTKKILNVAKGLF